MTIAARLYASALAALAVCAMAWFAPGAARAADPDVLWRIVHEQCEPDMRTNARPAPCLAVDLAGGYAVLKDIRGATQLLLIPTRRVTGVESPALLAPDSPNYWEDAWKALSLFDSRLGRHAPRGSVGFAVNSADGRSQNQLHIHIDCVRRDVLDAIRANQGRIGRRWAALDVDLAGRRYQAMRVDGADLGARDPFRLLAGGDPAAAADMGAETLVVLPTGDGDRRPGFILLSDHANLLKLDRASGEDLLDHTCAVLGPAVAPR